MSAKRTLTLAFGSLMVVLVFAALVAALAAGLASFSLSLGADWVVGYGIHWLIAFAALLRLVFRGALPIRWRIVGSAVIAAPLDEIWPLLVPRPGQPYHSNSVVRIEAAPDDPRRVTLHFDDVLADLGETAGPALEAVIEEQTFGKRLLMRYENPEIVPLLGRDLVASEILVAPEDGGYRVTFIEHMRAFRLSSLLVFLHLNPCEDATQRLKARCEGRADGSWMGTTIDAIRDNPDATAPGGLREFLFAALIVTGIVIGGLIVFTPMLFRVISGL